jgi:hypothetical protein
MPAFLANVPLIICYELHSIHDGVPTHLSRYPKVPESKVSWSVVR